MKFNKHTIAKLFISALVLFSVTSCAVLLEKPNNKKNTKKEVKSSSKQQSKSKR
ncbi:MAG: hypothetical protein SNH35_03260 [Rikenellaceae bacterium]